jgi:hypothetical protein
MIKNLLPVMSSEIQKVEGKRPILRPFSPLSPALRGGAEPPQYFQLRNGDTMS